MYHFQKKNTRNNGKGIRSQRQQCELVYKQPFVTKKGKISIFQFCFLTFQSHVLEGKQSGREKLKVVCGRTPTISS